MTILFLFCYKLVYSMHINIKYLFVLQIVHVILFLPLHFFDNIDNEQAYYACPIWNVSYKLKTSSKKHNCIKYSSFLHSNIGIFQLALKTLMNLYIVIYGNYSVMILSKKNFIIEKIRLLTFNKLFYNN